MDDPRDEARDAPHVQDAPDPTLRKKLVWLNLFRVVAVTVLLGGTAVASYATWSRGDIEASYGVFYAVVIAAYLASIGLALALRWRASEPATAWAQIALDVGLAAVLVKATGGSESVFVFMFLLAIVNGATVLYRRGAVVAAALAVGSYLVVTTAWPGHAPVRMPELFAHGAAFLLAAALASYLAEQLRATGARLAERESDLAVITGLHESIVQSMTSGLVTLDLAGRVIFLNRAGEAMAGLTSAQARGRPGAEVIPFEAGTGRGEVEHVTARGARLLLGYSVFPLVGADEKPLGTAIIFQDLTRLRAMEEAVQRGERLADLGRVAAGLAHELRNPLASLSGAIELLRSQLELDGEDRRLMDIAMREAARLDTLVSDFLRFARPPPPRRAAVDLAVVLDETLRVFAHDPVAAGVALEADLRPAAIEGDPDQLRQVAWNLLKNAAEALGGRPGGRIAIGCGPEAGGGVAFRVDDNGPGIPEAELERIFLPFHTTKERGSGLGLATVFRVVDAHGGRIAVDAAPGRGASFTVHLPARPPDALAVAAAG